jgi:hypothetical protein
VSEDKTLTGLLNALSERGKTLTGLLNALSERGQDVDRPAQRVE